MTEEKMKEPSKHKLLVVTRRGVEGHPKGKYSGESIVEITDPQDFSSGKYRESFEDSLKQEGLDDAIVYLSRGGWVEDMKTCIDLKYLADKYKFDLTLAACSCDDRSSMEEAFRLGAYFITTDCSGRGTLGGLVSKMLEDESAPSWLKSRRRQPSGIR